MFFLLFHGIHRKSWSQEDPTVAPAALRGWAPPFLVSVGGRPRSRREAGAPLNAHAGCTLPGLPLCRWT